MQLFSSPHSPCNLALNYAIRVYLIKCRLKLITLRKGSQTWPLLLTCNVFSLIRHPASRMQRPEEQHLPGEGRLQVQRARGGQLM